MIRFVLHHAVRRFERAFRYDAGYLHDIIDVSPAAARRAHGLQRFTGFTGPQPALWAGAALASVLDGDCGPCVQLTLDLAHAHGVPDGVLKACLTRNLGAAGVAGLGYRFAEAAIADGPELEALRDEITRRFGPEALIAASYAAAGLRAYPVLKRGLGHAQACQRLELGGEQIAVGARAA